MRHATPAARLTPSLFLTRFATLSVTLSVTLLTALSWSAPSLASTVTFDGFPLDPSGYYNGIDLAGGFSLDGKTFNNNFTDFGGGCCWDGWAISNHGDTTTPGFGNQYSSFTGGGFGGGGQFGVMYTDSASITLAAPETITGAYFTNTTYAALSMLNGDAFAKKFGGVSGSDPDWFNITIEGRLAGNATNSLVFYLADYRFGDPADDYVVDQWTWVDLSGLGPVDELRFRFDSSDVGSFGVNTPTYAAMDFLLSVPEPNSALLCALGLVMLAGRSKRSRITKGLESR